METEKERPNIRIEIQNEKMDVDEESENEDGEIVDEEPIQEQQNSRTVFTTGINIFDQEEQKKLQERAKRFALKPEEIHSFTDADLEELRDSLGITEDDENVVRFDTVHLLGTNDLLVEDILEYFAKYAPAEIEFVDEQSCNVNWLENVTAARAIFYSSKAVNGMPVRERVLVKDFLETDQPHQEEGQSILLKNRKVEFQVDDNLTQNKNKFKNAVNIEEITRPIPPGYWRLGNKHPKAKCLLLRFAFKTDKKPYKIESLTKYYKNLGSSKLLPDKRKEMSIFERNKDLPRGKNPWGNLARNWDQDAKFREIIPSSGETIEIKNANLATRLGAKAPSESENEVEIIEEETTIKKPKGRSMRMRMYADEEEERLKMKKAIQKLKKQTEKLTTEPKDLRAILTLNNSPAEPVEVIDLVQEDLGNRLKNRSKHMVFSLERDPSEIQSLERKENIRSDIRALLNRRRARSPIEDTRVTERSHRYRTRSPLKRNESPPVRQRTSHRRHHTPERTVRYRRYSRFRGRSEPSDIDNGTKPRSKVAVVIKTQKKPAVASTIWSRVQESESQDSSSDSDESSESEESDSSSSGESSGESESDSDSSDSSEEQPRRVSRPGFGEYSSRVAPRSHLKITMSNDRYRR